MQNIETVKLSASEPGLDSVYLGVIPLLPISKPLLRHTRDMRHCVLSHLQLTVTQTPKRDAICALNGKKKPSAVLEKAQCIRRAGGEWNRLWFGASSTHTIRGSLLPHFGGPRVRLERLLRHHLLDRSTVNVSHTCVTLASVFMLLRPPQERNLACKLGDCRGGQGKQC